MKKYKVVWQEVIITHLVGSVDANSKKEALKMVKDLKVHGTRDTNYSDKFGGIIPTSILAQPFIEVGDDE